MKRAGRLQSARKWLESFEGKNVVRGYAKWFGVHLICAFKELKSLGVELDPKYLAQLQTTCHNRTRKKQAKRKESADDDCIESDENFSYIAGYTSGGMPYGVPWDDNEDL